MPDFSSFSVEGTEYQYLIKKDETRTLKVVESEFKRYFKEVVADNGVDVFEGIKALSRHNDEHKQGTDGWHHSRDKAFTSTRSIIGRDGSLNRTNMYEVQSYLIETEPSEKISKAQQLEIFKARTHINPMGRGTLLEPLTANKMAFKYNLTVKEMPMTILSDYSFVGDSCDRHVTFNQDTIIDGHEFSEGEEILMEIKNPKHCKYLNPDYKNESKHFIQYQHHMIVNGYNKCLFVVDFPLMPPKVYVVHLDIDFATKFLTHVGTLDYAMAEGIELERDFASQHIEEEGF